MIEVYKTLKGLNRWEKGDWFDKRSGEKTKPTNEYGGGGRRNDEEDRRSISRQPTGKFAIISSPSESPEDGMSCQRPSKKRSRSIRSKTTNGRNKNLA